MTAFTPSSIVPFAAQSRLEPVPYSSPAKITVGVPRRMYSIAASYTGMHTPSSSVKPPSMRLPSSRGGSIKFFTRTLANVPRIITS